jgi:hypothetical protein
VVSDYATPPLSDVNTPCRIPVLSSTTMPKRQRKRPVLAASMLELFRAWGREGGKKGAKARWEGVAPEQRREIARKAARARWAKVKKG